MQTNEATDVKPKRSAEALAEAIENILGDATRATVAEILDLVQNLPEAVERLVHRALEQHGVTTLPENLATVQTTLAQLQHDLNHAVVSLTQTLAASNQRLGQLEVSLSEKLAVLDPQWERLEKSILDRLAISNHHASQASARLEATRELVGHHFTTLKEKTEVMASAIEAVAHRSEKLEVASESLNAVGPRVDELRPKIEEAQDLIRSLDTRIRALEGVERETIAVMRGIKAIAWVLVALVVLLGGGVALFSRSG